MESKEVNPKLPSLYLVRNTGLPGECEATFLLADQSITISSFPLAATRLIAEALDIDEQGNVVSLNGFTD